jgi:signal transduction histidine kinase
MADLIRDFFAVNQVVILFIYGQVFFVLGLVIVLQSWRHSRLALARGLTWLAAFGFTHGLHEWGDVFIPLQAQYLARPFIELLFVVQVVLLAVSFACLFQFGVETLRPLPDSWRLLRYLPGAALAMWVFWAFGPTLNSFGDATRWYRVNSIVARYSMGFPGALLAAYGLRHQAQHLIAPLEVPHIWRMLQVAGLALIGYSLMGGLAVPAANFFPANWFNAELVEELTLIPVQVYRSVLGLVLTLAIIRGLEVFQLELDRHLSSMEEKQMLIAERERIGRELHDGTLQTIYAAGLLLKSVDKELSQQNYHPESRERIQQVVTMLNEAVLDIRRYIGSLKTQGTLRTQPNTQSLVAGLQELASDRYLRSLVKVEMTLDLPEQRPMTTARVGHLLAIVNEGLSNVARHAKATAVYVSAAITNNWLRLEIKDNGRGLPNDYVIGYGLNNMRDRARMLGGRMLLESKPEHGTTVLVEVPWSESNENLTTVTG